MTQADVATTVLLMRHAESSNPALILGNETDLPLSPRGLLQAQQAARWLARRHPAAVYCSGLLRARQTAAPLAIECGLVPRVVADLHERCMGELSGRVRAEVFEHYRAPIDAWTRGDLDACQPGSESFAAVRGRFVPALERIARDHKGELVVVVAHGMAIRIALVSILAGQTPGHLETFGIRNASVNELFWDGQSWSAGGLDRTAADPHE